MKDSFNYIVIQMSQFDGEILNEKPFDTIIEMSKWLGVHRNTITNYYKRGFFSGKYKKWNDFVKLKKNMV